MPDTEYIINYQELANESKTYLKERVLSIEGIKIADCKIQDLVFFENKAIHTGNGVYIFKHEKQIIYIGSCSARNFVERVPAHFDIRPVGWFNSMLKRTVSENQRYIDDEKNADDEKVKERIHAKYLESAARDMFSKYSLVLINFEEEGEYIPLAAKMIALESFLLSTELLKPINAVKRRKPFKTAGSLNEILAEETERNRQRLQKRFDSRKKKEDEKKVAKEERSKQREAKKETKRKKEEEKELAKRMIE